MSEATTTFDDLGLKPEILRAIGDVGYTTPTPIQGSAIPVVLQGRDIVGIAQTGTGKTAGFTLPMIEILAQGRARARMPRSLILEPTRELAAQVAENFEIYGKYERLSYALLIGGSNMDEQIRKLDRGVDVLIATPGRMLDLFERGKVLLADVRILVIDEADRMLDMGFIPDIERIVSLLPPLRQTLLFSATMPPEIRRLAQQFLSNPKEIAVAKPATAATTVAQSLIMVDMRDKRAALRHLLNTDNPRNALIFCNRKRDVGVVCRSLQRHGFSAGQLHGDMAQPARMETLDRFKQGEISLLVCSDVAARGIDIAELSHVFNFDVPTHAEDYVHRIGRTGRAGRSGTSYTIATPDDAKHLAAVERLTGKPIDRLTIEEFSTTADESPPRKRKKTRGEATEAESAPPPQTSRRKPGPAPEKRKPGEAARSRRRDEPRPEPDSPVIGMGDHVPAFLLRPGRRRVSADDSEVST